MTAMTIDFFEIIGDALEEVREWLDYEADMGENNPWES